MKFIKDSFNTIGTRYLMIPFGLVSSVILARVLGPDGRGQFAQILLIITVIYRYVCMLEAPSLLVCVSVKKLRVTFKNAKEVIEGPTTGPDQTFFF